MLQQLVKVSIVLMQYNVSYIYKISYFRKLCCMYWPAPEKAKIHTQNTKKLLRMQMLMSLPCHYRTSVSNGEAEEAAASAELQTMEASLRDVRGHAEQRRAEAASQNSQGAVVKALLAAKASGQISGIHGRLGAAAHMPFPCILAGI